MLCTHEDKFNIEFKADCRKCFGLCCIALYFSASEGFPNNKDAGKPCINLQGNFACSIHKNLRAKGLKGCTAYDCFGAGQKVSQVTFAGNDWRQAPKSANQMFEAFLIVRQLHEMLWYLTQAFILQKGHSSLQDEINSLLDNTEGLSNLDVNSLLTLDVEDHRTRVNILLKNTSEMVRNKALSSKRTPSRNRNSSSRPLDYFGKDLRKINLKGADLRGAYLIAANLRGVDLSCADLIGADLRDADISGANLTNTIFLTQAQLNTAKGDCHTKLPSRLVPPNYWPK